MKNTLSIKNLLTILFLLVGQVCFAQDDIYKTVAQETCDCISKQNLEGQAKNQVQAALGLCMLESIQKNKVEVEISDTEAMKAFGQKVGVLMAPICPAVFKLFMKEAADEKADQKIFSLDGKIKSIEEDTFLYLVLKESSGNEHRLLWFSNFEGSDGFVTNPKTLVGKNVSLKYRSIQGYVPKAKGYMSLKELVALKLKE